MTVPVPLPDTRDPVVAPHWAAAREGRLSMQQCASCGYVRWPAAISCPDCLAEGGGWVTLSGRGTIWSLAIYEQPLHRAFEGECPYAVGLIELEEGPVMYARLTDQPDVLACGVPVTARFVELAPGTTVVRFGLEADPVD
jgi:uncharacterized protein